MNSASSLVVKTPEVVRSRPWSLHLTQMLVHWPQADVGLKRSVLGDGVSGNTDAIYMEAAPEGLCQELSQLEMFMDDKKQPKDQAR